MLLSNIYLFVIQLTVDFPKEITGHSNYENWMYWQNSTAKQINTISNMNYRKCISL